QGLLDFADEDQPAIGLRLEEERGMDDGLGLGGCQLVDQLSMHVAWPGPAPCVGGALVVDGNDGDPFGRLAPAAGTAEIVKAALQRADEVRGLMQDDHGHHDQYSHEPVRSPELATLCR